MNNDYEAWLKKNEPTGRSWTGKLVPLGAAGMATALVGLSVVMMAGLGLPAGDLPADAMASTATPAQKVRYAEPLPTVTVVGRREAAEPGDQVPARATTAALPARPASGEAATVGMTFTGDNLR